jgi:hypothetical protein
MPLSDEHIPSALVRDEIVTKAVLPQLASFAKEMGCPQSFRGIIRVQQQDVEHFGATDGYWTVRLIVRHTIKQARDIFRVQALVPKDAKTGFCGFQLRGDVVRTKDGFNITVPNLTGLYDTTGFENWS